MAAAPETEAPALLGLDHAAAAAAAAAEDDGSGGLLSSTTTPAPATAAPLAASPSSCPRLVGPAMPWMGLKERADGATAAGTPPSSSAAAAASAATEPLMMPPPAYSSPSPPRGLGMVGSKRPRSSASPPLSSSPSSPARPTTKAQPQQHTSVHVQAPSPPPVAPATATALVYDWGHVRHAHPTRKHPERPERVEAVLAHLESRGLLGRCRLLPLGEDAGASASVTAGVVAPEAALAGVHSQHYLARLRRLERAPLGRLLEEAEGFDSVYLNEATVDCARRAAGALLALVAALVKGQGQGQGQGEEQAAPVRNGLALIRPPGHHAEEHHARGFCVLNNVAVAAQHARQALGVARVLVVDWDIHHGNGTQKAFLADPSVLYLSVHRYDHGRFFPGTGNPAVVGTGPGEGYTVNVAWNGGGMGDREYRAVWRRLLLPVARAFAPELILVSAGFDGADGDEMGGCRVTPEGFGALTRALVEGVSSARGRVVLALEGGYKLSVLSRCVEACVEALLGSDSSGNSAAVPDGVDGGVLEEEEEEGAILPEAEEAIARALEIHRAYWPCLWQ